MAAWPGAGVPPPPDEQDQQPGGSMKHSGSAVKFSAATPDEDAAAKPKLRYGRLLASFTGGSSSSPQPADAAAPTGPRHTFNPAAAPAKASLKRQAPPPSAPLYPGVEAGAPVTAATAAAAAAAAAAAQPNPATGLVGHRTSAGAALAAALGVHGSAIPPPCPPALPNVPTTAAGGLGGGSSLSPAPTAAGLHSAVSNPLAVPDLPLMSPPSAVGPHAAAAARHSDAYSDAYTAAMPASATADGTVQLSMPGMGGGGSDSKLLMPDALLSHKQRDQSSADIEAVPAGGKGAHVHAEPDSPMGLALSDDGHHHLPDHDDDASSGIIIPPGSQTPLPPFSAQFTGRAIFAGVLVGCSFLLLTMRLSLVTGLAPSLQVVIAAACWAVLRLYTLLLGRDMQCIPVLTAQEVSVAAAAALAVASTAGAGSAGSVLLALQGPAAERVGSNVPGNLPSIVWSLSYTRIVCWLLLVVLSGALLMLPFRKYLYKSPLFTFATGAATGQLLNTLHTPAMSYHGHKQMNRFTQWSVISFLYTGYTWVFSSAGPGCNGFAKFPTFGLQALSFTWNFNSDLALCGLGIIAPLSIAWSLLVGGVISWGLLWPVLSSKSGSWFPAGLPEWDPRGVYGYVLITAIALLLSDALFHVGRAAVVAIIDWRHPENSEAAAAAATAAAASAAQDSQAAAGAGAGGAEAPEGPGPGMRQRRKKGGRKFSKQAWKREALRILDSDTLSDASSLQFSLAAMERALRQHIFMSDTMASWVGIVGFIVCSGVAVAALPALWDVGSATAVGGANLADARGLPFYFLLVAAPLAALAAFGNARAGGAVDVNLADACAKLGLLVFGAWAGAGNPGSTGAALLCGGVLLGAATSALNVMHAWRVGFMCMASPTAIFVAYLIGLAVGCVVAPAAYLLFDGTSAANPGATAGLLAADKFFASPLAAVFRSSAAVATGGPGALPHAMPWLGVAAFVVGLILNITREVVLPKSLKGLVPVPAALAVVFLSGANVAVGVFVGALVRVFWRLRYPRSAEAYSLVVGCALIAGRGLFALGDALLAVLGVAPPICMTFTHASAQ